MKIAVTGANGLLGRHVGAVIEARDHTLAALGRAELDVTDPTQCAFRIQDTAPDWVVHCAAFTAVDAAETEEDTAVKVNRDGTANVAQAAAACGARFLYVSTDYVFDGTSGEPYAPDHAVSPISVYGRTKRLGEEVALEEFGTEVLIVRIGWLYGAGGRNFVDVMRRVGADGREVRVVADQVGRPSWASDVADAMIDLIELDAAGIFHVANAGTASWLDFAREIFRLEGMSVPLTGVSTSEWGAAAPRPAFSALSLAETEAVLNRAMPHWKDALARYLDPSATQVRDAAGSHSNASEVA